MSEKQFMPNAMQGRSNSLEVVHYLRTSVAEQHGIVGYLPAEAIMLKGHFYSAQPLKDKDGTAIKASIAIAGETLDTKAPPIGLSDIDIAKTKMVASFKNPEVNFALDKEPASGDLTIILEYVTNR